MNLPLFTFRPSASWQQQSLPTSVRHSRHVCLQQCTAVFYETLGNNPLGNNWKYLPLREALYAAIFFSLKSSTRLAVSATPALISSAAAVVYTFHFFLLFIFLFLRAAINSYFLLLLQLVELIDFKLQSLPKNALDLSIWRWMCNPATPYCMILFLHGWVVNFNLLQDVSFFAFIVSCQCVFILYSLSSQPLSRARNGWWI